jgi:hypothetical protein
MARAEGRSGTDGTGRAGSRRTAPFGLIDVESGNMVGSFRSEREALLAVAATVQGNGTDSDAVRSLSLFRDDVPPEEGFIADGEELVRRALAAAPADDTTVEHLPT